MAARFLAWIVTTNVVNFAFYLAVTQCRLGKLKTCVFFIVGYVLPLLIYFDWLGPSLRHDEICMANSFSYGFALYCTIWGVNVMLMSRGALGRRLFAIIICGSHQVFAFAFSFLAMRRIKPTWAGETLAIALMAGLGALLVHYVIPRIHKMDDAAGWRELNTMAFLCFALLYATGIWPTYVAAGDWQDVIKFLIAGVVVLVSVPLVLAFAEKNRAARLRRMLVDNTRILQSDLRVARASEEGARRIRHDARHHLEVMRTFLQERKIDDALRYLEHTFSHEILLPPSNDRWCENPLVNSILKVGAQRAQMKGLGFQVDAQVPVDIGINESDLVALLSNLIENAVNGADGGAVRVSVAEDRGALRIGVSNRVAEGFKLIDGIPCESPGVGIFSIRAEVEKYHGLCDYILKDGELTARVMICMEGERKK